MKKLLLSLIVATSATVSFADAFSNNVGGVPLVGIEKGQTFDKLPQNSDILNLSAATVGIDAGFFAYQCTGVAISDRYLLTANHCVVDEDKTPWKQAIKGGDTVTLYLADGVKSAPKVERVYTSRLSVDQAHSGNDLSIIQYPKGTFKKFIQKAKIISAGTLQIPPSDITSVLAKSMWTGDKVLYKLGWGSNKKFQFGTVNVYNSSTNNVSFVGSLDRAMSSGTITYNFADLDKYLSLMGSPNNKTLSSSRVDSKDASLTNLLINGTAVLQSGDSGGPTFVCDNGGNSCNLIGVHEAVNSEAKVEFTTTLANPYFDMLGIEL